MLKVIFYCKILFCLILIFFSYKILKKYPKLVSKCKRCSLELYLDPYGQHVSKQRGITLNLIANRNSNLEASLWLRELMHGLQTAASLARVQRGTFVVIPHLSLSLSPFNSCRVSFMFLTRAGWFWCVHGRSRITQILSSGSFYLCPTTIRHSRPTTVPLER